VWKEAHQAAMDALKRALTSSPILAHPNFTEPFELQTDASTDGISAVLMQRDKVIEYASRAPQRCGTGVQYVPAGVPSGGVGDNQIRPLPAW